MHWPTVHISGIEHFACNKWQQWLDLITLYLHCICIALYSLTWNDLCDVSRQIKFIAYKMLKQVTRILLMICQVAHHVFQ